eukprot:5827112-Alexandrium_andersonii.AAC.1
MTEFYGVDFRERIRCGEAGTMLDGLMDYADSDIEDCEEGERDEALEPVEPPPRVEAALSAGDSSAQSWAALSSS